MVSSTLIYLICRVFEISTAESPAITTVMEVNGISFVVLVILDNQTVFVGNTLHQR